MFERGSRSRGSRKGGSSKGGRILGGPRLGASTQQDRSGYGCRHGRKFGLLLSGDGHTKADIDKTLECY